MKKILLIILALALEGCAFAPGMKLDVNARLDASDPTSIPVITPITPQFLLQEHIAHKQGKNIADNDVELQGVAQPYRIGGADVLSIIVWDHPELVIPNLSYTVGVNGNQPNGGMAAQALPGYVVSGEGQIQYPYVGLFKVEGLTEAEAQKKLRALLSDYISDPQITLRVIGYRSQKIYVDGEVRSAGVKPISDVPMTLSEALNQAGGIPSSGDASRITLVRGDKNYKISIPKLMERNVSPSAIVLQSGDVLRVAPLSENQVSVAGEVARPGLQPLRNNGNLSLSDAIGAAGGVNATTSDPSAIYVVRASADGGLPKVFHLDGTSPIALGLAANFQLQAKDVVYVDAPGLVRFSRVMSHLLGSSSTASSLSNVADKTN